MFGIGLIVGLVLGANISLFLYAMILVGKQSDEQYNNSRNEKSRSNTWRCIYENNKRRRR